MTAALAAACGDGPTGVPDAGISRADAEFLAVQLSGLGSVLVDEETAGFESGSSAIDGYSADVRRGPGLLRARACPAGGELKIAGEMSFSFEDGVLELGTRRRVDGEPSGLQETELEGFLAVTRESTGETRECEIDISSVYDPETGTREVTGTLCGHDVSERAGSDR
ncbi:MAG: hypothetical protein P8Y21_13060 [Gemmatimonadales bacterium]